MCVCLDPITPSFSPSLFLFADGQSARMWPGVSAAVLRNETPSAAFSWPRPCVVMLMSPRYQNTPTPPLIVVFDLPLILLIRSPTFKVKRFARTSESAPACACARARLPACLHTPGRNKIKIVLREVNCHPPFFSTTCPFANCRLASRRLNFNVVAGHSEKTDSIVGFIARATFFEQTHQTRTLALLACAA